MSDYDDIINLPHHQSKTRPLMSMAERAAQFSPFAALTGYIKLNGATPTQLLLALQRDKPTMIQEFEARSGGPYFEHLETIESQWSVLSNLKLFTGDKADAFELLCKQNIKEYYEMVAYNESKSSSYVCPPRVPANVRLAMLYEKQERYDRAIEICVEAIKAGATNDGSKGKMYGRLARLIRKSGIEADPEIKLLIQSDINTDC